MALQPNPANDKVTLRWPAGMAPEHIDVLGMDGRLLRSFSPGLNSEQIQLNLAGLSTGSYLVRTMGKSGPTLTRLIKRVD